MFKKGSKAKRSPLEKRDYYAKRLEDPKLSKNQRLYAKHWMFAWNNDPDEEDFILDDKELARRRRRLEDDRSLLRCFQGAANGNKERLKYESTHSGFTPKVEKR